MNETGTTRANAGDEVKRSAQSAAAELRERARATAQAVREDASERADAARTSLADDISALARAMHRGEQELRQGSPQSRAWQGIAGGLDSAAEALRARNIGAMARDLRDFARSNPASFLSGAFLVGLAVSRFARAGASDAGQGGETTAGGPE